jgi:hypothetical protein
VLFNVKSFYRQLKTPDHQNSAYPHPLSFSAATNVTRVFSRSSTISLLENLQELLADPQQALNDRLLEVFTLPLQAQARRGCA